MKKPSNVEIVILWLICFLQVDYFHFLCYLHEFSGYCDCFDKVLNCLLIFILTTDNFAIKVFNLMIPIIAVYKSSKTKLLKITNFSQYCLILNYFIELSLNLLLQHGDIEINPGSKGKCSQYFSCHWKL